MADAPIPDLPGVPDGTTINNMADGTNYPPTTVTLDDGSTISFGTQATDGYGNVGTLNGFDSGGNLFWSIPGGFTEETDGSGNFIGIKNANGDPVDPSTLQPIYPGNPNPPQTVGDPSQMITPYGTTATVNQTNPYSPGTITYTDSQGNIFDANGNLLASAIPINATASGLSTYLGPGWVDNGDGTYTNTITGQTMQGPSSSATNDQLLQQAGAAPIGGSLGSSNIGTGQLGNSAVQSILGALARLAQQAIKANNPNQLAAIQAAQLRFGGVPFSAPSSSTTSMILVIALLAGAALLAGRRSAA